MLLGPSGGGVSGGLEAARSKGVLGFNGIKMHRMAGGLVLLIYPMRCNVPCNSSRREVYGILYIQAIDIRDPETAKDLQSHRGTSSSDHHGGLTPSTYSLMSFYVICILH